jgi:hypothetical protein
MGKAELAFYRALTNVLIWMTWLCAVPLVFLGGLLIGEVFYWLAEAHWVRVTLCTLGNYLGAPNIPKVNQFVAHEMDRCDVGTGARGLDLIINCVLNELPAFISLAATITGAIYTGFSDLPDRHCSAEARHHKRDAWFDRAMRGVVRGAKV